MKIRTDFVTNSSSSSFIIAFKNTPYDIETYKIYNKVIDALINIECNESTHKGKVFTTKEELDNYFIKNYGFADMDTLEKIFEDEDYLKEIYNNCVEYINNDYIIIIKDIDNNDEGLYLFIKEFSKNNDRIIIIEENC